MIQQVVVLILLGYAPGAVFLSHPGSGSLQARAAGRGRTGVLGRDAERRPGRSSSPSSLAALHRYTSRRRAGGQRRASRGDAGPLADQAPVCNATPPGATAIAPLALLALVCWLHPPPAEYIVGGKDPGVYVNAGIQIAQRGSLIAVDETARVGAGRRRGRCSSRSTVGQPYYSPRFMGFFLLDPDAGTVIDQFPHLYPTAIAIGYSVDGLTGARDVGIDRGRPRACWRCTFSARGWPGRLPAPPPLVLLAINVIEVWYARYPNSEMLTQALGLDGAARRGARRTWTMTRSSRRWQASSSGLLPFARFDAVLISGLVVVAVAAAVAGRRSPEVRVPVSAGDRHGAVHRVSGGLARAIRCVAEDLSSPTTGSPCARRSAPGSCSSPSPPVQAQCRDSTAADHMGAARCSWPSRSC